MITEEIFKSIEGYEGIYEISNYGNVRGLNFHRQGKTRIMKNERITNAGYLRISLCKGCKKKQHSIHRLVASAFIPNPENKKTVNHKDGNKLNNKSDNLEWSTHKENIIHSWDKGLSKAYDRRGENHSRNKLNNEDVINIRAMYSLKEYNQRQLANMYNCTYQNIHDIVRLKSWRHI